MSASPDAHLQEPQQYSENIKQNHPSKLQRPTFSNHHIYICQSIPTMSSPATLITIASDVVVLGAAVSVAGVGIKSLATRYSMGAASSIKSTLGGTQSYINDDDDLI